MNVVLVVRHDLATDISKSLLRFGQFFSLIVKLVSHVRLSATPWTVARQAPLCMGFSRQGDWSGLSCPPPGDLPHPGIKPSSPALQAESLKLVYFIHSDWSLLILHRGWVVVFFDWPGSSREFEPHVSTFSGEQILTRFYFLIPEVIWCYLTLLPEWSATCGFKYLWKRLWFKTFVDVSPVFTEI